MCVCVSVFMPTAVFVCVFYELCVAIVLNLCAAGRQINNNHNNYMDIYVYCMNVENTEFAMQILLYFFISRNALIGICNLLLTA